MREVPASLAPEKKDDPGVVRRGHDVEADMQGTMTGKLQLSRVRIERYPDLNDVTLSDLKPLTILLGANGSGKSQAASSLHWLQQLTDYGCAEATRAVGAGAADEIRMTVEAVDDTGATLCYEVRTGHRKGQKPDIAYERVRQGNDPGTVILEITNGRGYAVPDGAGHIERKRQPIELASTTDSALRILGNLTEYRSVSRLARWIARWQIWAAKRPGAHSPAPSGEKETNAHGDNLLAALKRVQAEAPEAWNRILAGLRKVCNLDNLQIAVRQAGFGIIDATASFGEGETAAIERMGLGFNKALVTLMLIEQTPDGGLILLDDMDTNLDTAAARRLTQQLQKARERVQIIGTTSRQDTCEWTSELKAWTRRRAD